MNVRTIQFAGKKHRLMFMECPYCGTVFALPEDLYVERLAIRQDHREDSRHGVIHCPVGCGISWIRAKVSVDAEDWSKADPRRMLFEVTGGSPRPVIATAKRKADGKRYLTARQAAARERSTVAIWRREWLKHFGLTKPAE